MRRRFNMATKVKYNITTVVGSYEKNGETKKKYLTLGTVMEKDDNSRFILLDPLVNLAAIPRPEGRDRIICSLMEPKEKEDKPKEEAWEE